MSPQQTASSSKAVPIMVGGIVLLAILALVAVIATSGDDNEAAQEAEAAGLEQQRPVEVAGTPLPVLAEGQDPAVGAQIPTLQGQTFAGDPMTVGPDGAPKLVLFLAHWCPNCQAEVPRVVERLDGGTSINGVEVVGVATNTDETAPNYPPSAWLENEGWTAPTLADDVNNPAASAYGLSAFPFWVAVDADGRVVARTTGELSDEGIDALTAAAAGT